MNNFFDKVKQQLLNNLPFVIYNKPNEDKVIGNFQKDNQLHFVDDFSEKGFVFCSFDGLKNIIIPKNLAEIVEAEIDFDVDFIEKKISISNNEKAKIDFEKLVQNGIKAIKSSDFQKLVLSRKEVLENIEFDLVNVFLKLINSYKSAFCYCFYHPKVGLWIGASPEQLLQIEDLNFKTVALAGTQKNENLDQIVWHEKEKQEQLFVTNFIVQNLEKKVSEIKVSEPFTVQAGNIVHIKTNISGILNSNFNAKEIISILHPTPAVCGLPKLESKEFIIQNEGYEREFYTGFFGELNLENKSDLFVNLRCMQIVENNALIYIGCGITKESIPEKEWEESQNKALVMKKILKF